MSKGMKKGELTSGAKSVDGSGRRGIGKRIAMFSSAIASESTA
jgi:hypothetical protein